MGMHKRKILLSGILALLLVGCSGVDKSGSGTGGDNGKSKEVDIETRKETLEVFDNLEDGAKTSEESFNVSMPTLDLLTDKPVVLKYQDLEMDGLVVKPTGEDGKAKKLIFNDDLEEEKVAILVEKNAHLEFDEDKIKTVLHLVNKGNIYFTDDDNEKGVTIQTGVISNYGNIYSIGENKVKILSIDGSYIGKGEDAKIYLGLYVDKEKNITTDGVIINGTVSGKTKIHFVFDKGKIDEKEEFKIKKDYWVIRANAVKYSDADSVFSVAGGTVPVGNKIYELKYRPENNITKIGEDDFSIVNYWDLKKKK